MYNKSNKRKLQAQKTRRNIFKCATKLFSEKGFENVTLEDIVSEAGVSIGAFYHHFKCKEDVFSVSFNDLDDSYEIFYNSVILNKDINKISFMQKIIIFMVFAVRLSTDKGGDYFRNFYIYSIRDQEVNKKMIDRSRRYFRILDELVGQAMAHGEISEGIEKENIIDSLWTISRGCTVGWSMDRGIQDAAKILIECLIYYIRGITCCRYPSDCDQQYTEKTDFDEIFTNYLKFSA